MFKNNSHILKNAILNNNNFKNKYMPYVIFVNNVRKILPENIDKLLYIYENFIPFDIKKELVEFDNLAKIVELKKRHIKLYNKIKAIIILLTDESLSDYEVFTQFILEYTDIPNKKVFGGRCRRTRRNHSRRQIKTKRNLRK